MSRVRRWRSDAPAAALAAVLLTMTHVAAQVTVPHDFEIPKAESSPGTVTFSHARHLPRVGTCSACHMRDLKMKRGASGITLEGKQEGKFCGACHDGKTNVGGAPTFPIEQCDGCHK
jgi:c(7)-type cytochrome triheme protein